MDLAIAERLVCPAAHAPTPLIIRADQTRDGRLVTGVLGCAVCRRDWPVEGGEAQFGDADPGEPVASPDALALAAYLGLTEPGALVVTDGVTSDAECALADEYGAQIVAIDPFAGSRAPVIIRRPPAVPLAARSARGAVLLRADRDERFVASAVLSLAPGGRLVAASAIRATGVVELARESSLWVGERERTSDPVPLRRR